jgi:hypothetical protein
LTSSNVIEFVSRAERNHMLATVVILPLARMIESGQIDVETVTRAKFLACLKGLGKSHETAFEAYVNRIEEELRLVSHCVKQKEAKSGIVLLFTLLESEINTLLRIHLRIKSFSQNAITEALQGTDFETKLNVLLPLLDVHTPERLRNCALQCKAIRNLVVHNKGMPNLMSHEGDKPSDTEVAERRASKFFIESPLPRLQRDLQKFMEEAIYSSWAVEWASHLFAKYYERGEA